MENKDTISNYFKLPIEYENNINVINKNVINEIIIVKKIF